MRLGYYFHHPAFFLPDGRAAVPSSHGMFIDQMAKEAGHLVFFAHPAASRTIEDMELDPSRVTAVPAGRARSAPLLTFASEVNVRAIREQLRSLDALLIRAPTPMLPGLVRAARGIPVVALLVADYTQWQPSAGTASWRNLLIRRWISAYQWLQARAFRSVLVLPISALHARRLSQELPYTKRVFTSSIREQDVMTALDAENWSWDPRAGRERPARLLNTGRLVDEKGLLDVLDAMHELSRRGWSTELILAGWWADEGFKEVFDKRARDLGLSDAVTLEGYVAAGRALMDLYRQADVFVFPTRNDAAVARSLKEAMVSHLPTVTTRIPVMEEELIHGAESVLVDPGSPGSLAEGLESLLGQPELAAKVARGGWEWARRLTNEQSCALIMDQIREWARAQGRHT